MLRVFVDRAFTEHAKYFKRSEEHTSELQSRGHLVCRLLLEKKKQSRLSATRNESATSRNNSLTRGSRRRKSGFRMYPMSSFFFFNDTATTEIYTLSLHDALPISSWRSTPVKRRTRWTIELPRTITS